MALTLCGCALPSENRTAPAPLAVAIPDTCEKVLATVPLPKVAAADDARAAFVKDEAALMRANRRIAAGRACVADVRARYAAQ